MFRQMPIILALVIIVIVCFGASLPISVMKLLYGVSLSIKSLIIFLLPIIIFGLLFKVATNLAKDVSKIIMLTLFGVIISNFFTTTLSQILGMWIYNFDMPLVTPDPNNDLVGTILFELPSIIPNHVAMFSAIILGLIVTNIEPKLAEKIGLILEKIVKKLLSAFSFLIPTFVAGFIVKLQYDGIVVQIVKDYTLIFGIVTFAQFGYIFFLYLVFNKFNVTRFIVSIKNMIPATLSGFSTMSSASSMPLTLVGTEKNAKNKNLVHTVIPATVNIHLIGDCVAIPCFAFAILNNYDMAQPDIYTYFIFTCYFVLAKFSVAAIPGGGIVVMLPILDQYLGFNTEMLSLITALYILFDPVITSANVMGNGAFAKIIDIVSSKETKNNTSEKFETKQNKY